MVKEGFYHMRKICMFALAIVLVLAVAVPALGGVDAPTQVDKKAWDNFPEAKQSANNNEVGVGNGITLVSNSKTGWNLVVDEGVEGDITVAYKIGPDYFVKTFAIKGANSYFIGDGSGKNGINQVKLGQPVLVEKPVDPPVEVNLGFIGYYMYEGNVLSTSIHWQHLEKEGDMIDWNAVDAAYADWVSQGGLKPDRSAWLTSGYASFTFKDYAALGYGDFNIGQLEDYYKAYYVDPGYVLPGEPVIVNLGFIGHYLFEGKVLSTSIHWQILEKAGDMIDWGAVDAAYDAWVAKGGLEPDRTTWKTSGFATFYFDNYAALGYGDFNIGQMENYYKSYYVAPGYVLPTVEAKACGCEKCDACGGCVEKPCECDECESCACVPAKGACGNGGDDDQGDDDQGEDGDEQGGKGGKGPGGVFEDGDNDIIDPDGGNGQGGGKGNGRGSNQNQQ